ncbi:MAG TPA: hypothetical protein VLM89_07725, partial [Phycisphaerae bacterium]|nr:hypothetical protein [Phycisphaerae bacterium]
LFFETLRHALNLAEKLTLVVKTSDWRDWHTLLFLYLSICLTVRMAPLTGNIRGALGAILVAGILAYLISRVSPPSADTLNTTWTLITYSVAVLSLLLILSLLITGAVRLVKVFLESK